MRRAFLLLTVLLMPCWLGCAAAHRTVPSADVTAAREQSPERFKRFAMPKGQPVVGYTTTDGRYHRLKGTARLEGDAVVFRNQRHLPWNPGTVRVPFEELESVRSEYVNPVPIVCGSILLVGGLVAAIVAITSPPP